MSVHNINHLELRIDHLTILIRTSVSIIDESSVGAILAYVTVGDIYGWLFQDDQVHTESFQLVQEVGNSLLTHGRQGAKESHDFEDSFVVSPDVFDDLICEIFPVDVAFHLSDTSITHQGPEIVEVSFMTLSI